MSPFTHFKIQKLIFLGLLISLFVVCMAQFDKLYQPGIWPSPYRVASSHYYYDDDDDDDDKYCHHDKYHNFE